MYAQTILGNRVQLIYTGKRQGNFSPKVGGGIFNPRIDPIRGILGGSGFIFSPRLGFTTRWIEVGETREWTLPEQWFWRSAEPADGVILSPPKDGVDEVVEPIPHSGVVGFNADCPFGVILWPDGRLGFCHLGLECVLPKDESPGILDTAGLEPGCVVHLTAGIGPCCYGRNGGGFDYVFKRFPEVRGDIATRGLRKGQPSLDLHKLILLVLMPHNIDTISVSTSCTACAVTPDGTRLYYSNVADRGTPDEGGRNCVAVWRIAP